MSGKGDDLEAAYILHRRSYRENSLILDAFCLKSGRLSLVAKGAYSQKKSGATPLQAFQPLLLTWLGQSELKTLTRYECPSPALALKGKALYCAYYVNELLLYLLPSQEPQFEIFEAYAEVLGGLSSDDALEWHLRVFEIRLLMALGLWVDLTLDNNGSQLEADCRYQFDPDRGFERTFAETQAGYSGNSLLLISAWQCSGFGRAIEAEILSAAKALNRRLIDLALNGRPLKSREMMRQLYNVSSFEKKGA